MKEVPNTPFMLESFSKALELIFTLSTGALALSITFRSDVTSSSKAYLWILSIAWVLLATTSLCYILIKAFESGIEMQITTKSIRYRITIDRLRRARKRTLRMLDEIGAEISEDEKRNQINALCDEQQAALKKLRSDIDKESKDEMIFITPIIGLVKISFLSFFMGIASLLVFGILSNIKEANQALEPMIMTGTHSTAQEPRQP